MLWESDYIQPPKPLPPIPVRVSRRSQLTAALRQHARPIVIEDQGLARPFARLLRARELRLWAVGEFVADTMSHAIGRSYGANVEAHWYVGRYVLPGNVQKVILKPKPYGIGRLPRHLQAEAADGANEAAQRKCCERQSVKQGALVIRVVAISADCKVRVGCGALDTAGTKRSGACRRSDCGVAETG